MANSTTSGSSSKPAKPRPDFPLFPHATGRWAKKVRGKFQYFGYVADDPDGKLAETQWSQQKDDLLAGRTPRVKVDGFTIQNLVNDFLAGKRHLVDTCEIGVRQFSELFNTCQRVGNAFGWSRLVADLSADDFSGLRKEIAKQWGPVRLGNEVQRVRSLFKFGRESGLCPEPVYGPTFKKPSKKVIRKQRATKGKRMLQAADLRMVVAKAGVPLAAMTLLGVNCGFGNADVASLPMQALDLAAGWVNYPRPKTGVDRRCKLWPETIAALQTALANRPKTQDRANHDLVFLTKFGRPWRVCELRQDQTDETDETREKGPKLRQDDAVAKAFVKVLKALGLHRHGLGFYALRHTFETIGGGAKDQVAVNAIMGHVDETIAGSYREEVEDSRLEAVVHHVRQWLFPEGQRLEEALPTIH